MPGSFDLFDFDDLTAWSESSPRNRSINTLQIHHATTTSYSGLRSLMNPGGRTVSANGGMTPDGKLGEIVRTFDRRAFTSATAFDNQCLTVEVCNVSLGPGWGISEASRVRLARLAVGMFRKGILGGLDRRFIIGHSEVPGTYATACPGPDMHLDHIVALAREFHASGDSGVAGAGGVRIPIPIPRNAKDHDMLFLRVADDGNGKPYFTLFNTNTNTFTKPIYSVAPAGWTKAFGPHVEFSRADFLGLSSAIQAMTGKPLFQVEPK